MNCKPGDLAVVVRGEKSRGRIVRCIRLLQYGEVVEYQSGESAVIKRTDEWLVDGLIDRFVGGRVKQFPIVYDEALRPIRDPGDDATDEMVQLLGKPSEVTA